MNRNRKLHRLNVRRLPTLGPLDHVELHSLTFLKALETVRIDRREVNKHVLAVLTADEAKPLGIVKPLHCSLFHYVRFLWWRLCCERRLAPSTGENIKANLPTAKLQCRKSLGLHGSCLSDSRLNRPSIAVKLKVERLVSTLDSPHRPQEHTAGAAFALQHSR
jgi:hypothetical protein